MVCFHIVGLGSLVLRDIPARGKRPAEKKWVFTILCRNGRGELGLVEAWGPCAQLMQEFFAGGSDRGISTYVWQDPENMSASDKSKNRMFMGIPTLFQIDNFGAEFVFKVMFEGYADINDQITSSTYPKPFTWVGGKYFDELGKAVRDPSKWGQPEAFSMDSLFAPVDLEETGSPMKKSKPST